MVKSYGFRAPAFRQSEVVSRIDHREGSLERPIILSKYRSIFERVAVSKNSARIRVLSARDSSQAVFVVDVVKISRDIDRIVFSITLCFAAGPDQPRAKLF